MLNTIEIKIIYGETLHGIGDKIIKFNIVNLKYKHQ